MLVIRKVLLAILLMGVVFSPVCHAVTTEESIHQAVTTIKGITDATGDAVSGLDGVAKAMVEFKTEIDKIINEWEEAESRYNGQVPEDLSKNLTLKIRLAVVKLNSPLAKNASSTTENVNSLKEMVIRGVDEIEAISERGMNAEIPQRRRELVRGKEALEKEIKRLINEQKGCRNDSCKARLQNTIDRKFDRIENIIVSYESMKVENEFLEQFNKVMKDNALLMKNSFLPAADKFHSHFIRLFRKFSQVNTGAFSDDMIIASKSFREGIIAFRNLSLAMDKTGAAMDNVNKLMRDEGLESLRILDEKYKNNPSGMPNINVGESNDERLARYKGLTLD
ncbi:hypothetical protein [Desulfatibacillum aliphaticivorans]|uniref:hypothetical protein n=1 Tax=Desulfatibacillum aliphaticivorans TaxID=218208 RepID=UPI00040433E9|nr:hypothetical protein [Desulfatibacillum aliphaticivorans]